MDRRLKSFTLMCLTLGQALLCNNLQAANELVDGLETKFQARGGVSYYSNLFLIDDALAEVFPVQDSFLFVVDPTLIVSVGDEESTYNLNWDLGLNIMEIETNSNLSQEEFHTSLAANFKGTRARWNLRGGIREQSLPSQDSRTNGALTPRENRDLGWNGSYKASQRTRIAGGVSYNSLSYEDTEERNFNDWETIAIPFRIYYSLSEDFELGAGLRYRTHQVEIGSDRDDIAWHIAVEGQATSKLKVDAKIGLLQQSFDSVSEPDTDDVFLSASANWTMTSQTRFNLDLDRDIYSSSFLSIVERDRARLSFDWQNSEKMLTQFHVLHEKENYKNLNRQDDLVNIGASLNYTPNKRSYFQIGLYYEENASNRFGFDYDNLVLNGMSGWSF